MKVGIGLPGNVPGAKGDVILEWARRADAGPFSTLGAIDRLVYDNYEPMIQLAAAAGCTSNVRLLTGVLLAPLRNPGVLAKQAATLDAISGGRLTLGVGVGRRPDDYAAAPAAYNTRGRTYGASIWPRCAASGAARAPPTALARWDHPQCSREGRRC